MLNHFVGSTDLDVTVIGGLDIELLACADTTQGNNQQGHDRCHAGTKQQADRHAVKDGILDNGEGTGHQRQRRNKDRSHTQLGTLDSGLLDLVALCYLEFHKLHNQDRLSNDDATESDHADHGGRRELGTHDPVAGNDTQHGDRDR